MTVDEIHTYLAVYLLNAAINTFIAFSCGDERYFRVLPCNLRNKILFLLPFPLFFLFADRDY